MIAFNPKVLIPLMFALVAIAAPPNGANDKVRSSSSHFRCFESLMMTRTYRLMLFLSMKHAQKLP